MTLPGSKTEGGHAHDPASDARVRGRRRGTNWGISTGIDDHDPPDAMLRDNALTASLQRVRTRVDAFGPAGQGHQINWGYALTDAAMRRHVIEGGSPEPSWPAPDHPL